MTDPHATDAHVPSEREESIVRILDAYFSALQAGQAPNRAEVLAAHPDLAAVLEPRLAALDFIHRTGQAPAGAPVQVGDFRIVREIGRGGMGVVYEAEQISLRRRVALKILRLGEPASPEAVARFRREAEMVARLHHTNIVPIFAVGCEQGVHYFAMQLIEGRSLAAAPGGPLPPPREVAGWGRQAAEALAHAHARSIIHRDVKPSNLLLDGEGVVWLSDFGLARGMDETALTAAGVQPGTPDYMSPEQVAAAVPIDHRTDLYSLGATLYKLATGRRVFEADNLQQLLAQVREDEPVAPRKHRPDLPRDVETIILRCLAKAPDDRYASARTLADDLRAFTEDRPIKARRPSIRERARRWLAGKRFTGKDLAGIGVGAAVVVALLLVWGMNVRRHMSRESMGMLYVSINPNNPNLRDGASRVIDPPLSGELLDPWRDELVQKSFEIPTKAALRIPAGRYRLRLSRPGWLSISHDIYIRSGQPSGEIVDPEIGGEQHLWPQPIKNAVLIEYMPADKGHDLIVKKSEPGPTQFSRNVVHVQRLRGGTGKMVWNQKVESSGSDLSMSPVKLETASIESAVWAWASPRFTVADCSLALWVAQSPLTVRYPNLVWTSGYSATLLCQSGNTGKFLWRHPNSEPPAENAGEVNCVCGLPQFTKVGKDLEPGIIALVYRGKEAHYRLQALTERNGQAIWDVPLAGSWPISTVWDNTLAYAGRSMKGVSFYRPHEERPAPALVTIQRRTVAVCVVGGMLQGIDVQTGKPEKWSPWLLPYRLLRPAQFADLNSDGNTDALLLHEDEPRRLTLTALDLSKGGMLWEKTWPGVPEPFKDLEARGNSDRHWAQDWPLLVDLDGDGRTQVVVRLAEFSPHHHLPDRFPKESVLDTVVETIGVLVLEGATGQEQWTQRLSRSRSSGVPARRIRLTVGPAPMGGGPRELIVASLVVRWGSGLWAGPELYVDALRGTDGKSLWWWRHVLGDSKDGNRWDSSLGKLDWWTAEVPGEEILLVPLRAKLSGASEQSFTATYLLDRRTGKPLNRVPSLERPHTVDLDGDGLPELAGSIADQPCQPIRGSTLTLLTKRLQSGNRPSESQPSVLPTAKDDPRRRIPLPLFRDGEGDEKIYEEGLLVMFMLWVPCALVVFLCAVLHAAARKCSLKAQGMPQTDVKSQLQAQDRWVTTRLALAHLASGLLLVLAIAVVFLALDDERRSDESYIWTLGLCVYGVLAWMVASLTLAALTGTFFLVRKVLRRLRRKSP